MSERPRIAFFCHGSTRVGLGHVMRSRTVAEAAAGAAEARLFVVGDGTVEPLLAGRGTRYEIFGSDADAARAIEAFGPAAVCFDMLRVDDAAFRRCAAGRTSVSLSPVFSHLDDVDLFFHRTRSHPGLAGGARPGWRCGLEYAVIRPECTRIGDAAYAETLDPSQPLSVAVSMGGGDATNRTLRVLRALRELPGPMVFWVLLGEGYQHSYQELVECVRRDTRHEIILAKTSDSMWRVMKQCAVAVLAAGTVTYEAAAAGMPSINTFEDEAHRFLIEELVERGAAFDAGAPFDAALGRVRGLLAELDADRRRLAAARRATAGLIDGNAAGRIVRETLAAARLCAAAA